MYRLNHTFLLTLRPSKTLLLTIRLPVSSRMSILLRITEQISSSGQKLMAIVSVLECSETKKLYRLVREFCPKTLLLSVIDNNCPRPDPDLGIGFPVMTSVKDITPLLLDLRQHVMNHWDHIALVHDNSIGTIDQIIFHGALIYRHWLCYRCQSVKRYHTFFNKCQRYRHQGNDGYLIQHRLS